MNQSNYYNGDLIENFPNLKKPLRIIYRQIAERPQKDQKTVRKALERYTREGVNHSYHTRPSNLIRLIERLEILDGADEVVDFGAGPGELIGFLAAKNPGVQFSGIDLSPGFVSAFNTGNDLPNASMQLGLIDEPIKIQSPSKAVALSVLTPDRLSYPRVLLENMAMCRKQLLATLLPIDPVDDNPSIPEDERTVYTRPRNRIVPGKTFSGDRKAMLELLRDIWRRDVRFSRARYQVNSSGDRQKYNLGVFYTS